MHAASQVSTISKSINTYIHSNTTISCNYEWIVKLYYPYTTASSL